MSGTAMPSLGAPSQTNMNTGQEVSQNMDALSSSRDQPKFKLKKSSKQKANTKSNTQ